MNSIDEELNEAANENNLSEVRRLLSVGADVNATGNRDRTPLHKASDKGHSQVVMELVDHGADMDAKDSNGWTPLHCACWHGHLAVFNELMSLSDSNGTTTSILGKRTSRGGANMEAKDNQGNTPLHAAARLGHLPVVKALLRGGASILAANNEGWLPIHSAVTFRKSEVAKCLLQKLYATTRRLPLHELVEDLTGIGHSNRSGALHLRFALLDGNVLRTDDVVEILEYLVRRNPAWLCSRNQDGSLPLHVACRRGVSFKIVQSLVNLYKASVKSVTPEGDAPLFLACEMPYTSLDTIFLLVKLYPDLVYR
jgi:ankyrin repeat protein